MKETEEIEEISMKEIKELIKKEPYKAKLKALKTLGVGSESMTQHNDMTNAYICQFIEDDDIIVDIALKLKVIELD